MKTMAFIAAFSLSPLVSDMAFAETTTTEKVGQTSTAVKDGAKDGVREMKDAACEMINGKMECAGKKLKHKAEKGVDKVKAKAGEVKDKVD